MAKKPKNKQAESALKRNAPAEAKWLTQPINITFMRGDMTLNQVNTMIEVVDALQDRIAYALTNKVKSVFEDKDYDAEGKVVVPVPFAAMTDDARRYQYYESIARSLAETSVTIEKIGDDGKPYTSIKPIINEARIPKTDSGYREGNIEFVIEKDMIETLFDINRYNRYIKSVAKNSKSVYTSRIYQFITAYKNIGYWKPKYEDLHIMFGFSEYKTDKETKVREWTPIKYPNYRQFKQKILKVAHDELKELADKGEVDCYFEFSEQYPTSKQMGKPERIVFKIISTKYGMDHDKKVDDARMRINIENGLKEFGCSTTDIRQMMKLVDADNAECCMAKIHEVQSYIEAHKDKIDNVKAYAISAIRNALVDMVENLVEEPLADEGVEGVEEDEGVDEVKIDDRWSRVASECSDAHMKMVLEGLELKGNTLYANTKTFVEMFGNEIREIMNRVGVSELKIKK